MYGRMLRDHLFKIVIKSNVPFDDTLLRMQEVFPIKERFLKF